MKHLFLASCILLFFSIANGASHSLCPMCNKKFVTSTKALVHINNTCPIPPEHEKAKIEENILIKQKEARRFLNIVAHLNSHPGKQPTDFFSKAKNGIIQILHNQIYPGELKKLASQSLCEIGRRNQNKQGKQCKKN